MSNKRSYLFRQDALSIIKYVVPTYASRCEILKDTEGYWINVWWHCGAIAPLTHNEEAQALGE
jgi:hypothetical protein